MKLLKDFLEDENIGIPERDNGISVSKLAKNANQSVRSSLKVKRI